jgi:hypothetical protein
MSSPGSQHQHRVPLSCLGTTAKCVCIILAHDCAAASGCNLARSFVIGIDFLGTGSSKEGDGGKSTPHTAAAALKRQGRRAGHHSLASAPGVSFTVLYASDLWQTG